MSQSEQSTLTTPALSITNFDLSSLHLLHNEIIVTLKNVERQLSDFNDDPSQARLLIDSVDNLTQLSRIFDLISLRGGQLLSLAIAQGLQLLCDTEDNTDIELIMDLSEAIMTLDRYIEFVLLTETIEPTLLLPIINKLHDHSDHALVNYYDFASFGSSSVIIANPEHNFESLNSLGLDTELLTNVYRSGLDVVLTYKNGTLTTSDQQRLDAMSAVCTLIAERSDSLFWQAAAAAVIDIETLLPLSSSQKHTLIYLEQQFNSYLPIMDVRFADLVSFACQRDSQQAQRLREQYFLNQLESSQHEEMRRFLFGPNKAITDILNDLIQDKIRVIKEKVDSYVRADTSYNNSVPADKQTTEIVSKIKELSSILKLLGLSDTATSLQHAATAVTQWLNPSAKDFDYLLLALMKAENASITIAKMHTPGAIHLRLNNPHISAHQLDTAYDTLVKESRANIRTVEKIVADYLESGRFEFSVLQTLPEMARQVAGAVRFLQLPAIANMCSQLANYVEQCVQENHVLDATTFAHIANVMMAVDYQLAGFENHQPINKRSLDVGQHSLSSLLAA